MAKLRVHELAKELGITSKELMGHLKEAGEFVKSSSSSLEPPVVRQMREKFAAAHKSKKAETKPAPKAPKPGAAKPAPKKPAAPQASAPEATAPVPAPKAPTPKAPTPKAPTPKAPAPKAAGPKPGAPKPGARKSETAPKPRGRKPAEGSAPKPGGRKPAEGGAPKPAPRRGDAPRPARPGAPRPGGPRPGNNPYASSQGMPRPGGSGNAGPRPGAPRPGGSGNAGPRPGAPRPGAPRPGGNRPNPGMMPGQANFARNAAAGNNTSERSGGRGGGRGRGGARPGAGAGAGAGAAQNNGGGFGPRGGGRGGRGSTPGAFGRGGGRSQRGRKSKRAKRQEYEQQNAPVIGGVSIPRGNGAQIRIRQGASLADLAEKIDVNPAALVTVLFALGEMATATQSLDQDTFEALGAELGYDVKVVSPEDEDRELLESFDIDLEAEELDDAENMEPRPPVVTVMGHVDHGKTSLLDAIRNTSVSTHEAGGITQHIGAYQVICQGKKIVFLDTPGHEAFTAMRARGAQITDVAILVVAADDGVMPQTIEAIDHAKSAGVPIIIAINKIDKPGANPDRVKQELMEYGLVSEEYGGDTIMVPVSAKQRIGIDDLLENILLVAEVEELKANPNREARGVIIEAKLDKGRGSVATVLVQSGTLRIGDSIVVGTAYGHVRAMINDRGDNVKKAGPSMPVEILGLNDVPSAGDILAAVDEKQARSIAEARLGNQRRDLIKSKSVSLDALFQQIQEGDIKDLNILVKADVQGSVEALNSALLGLNKNDEVRVSIVHSGVGAVSESDIMLASASQAIVIAFNVRPDANARRLADTENVDIRTYRVIYDALNDVKDAMSGMLKPKYKEVIQGRVEIRQVMRFSKALVAGSYVLEGKIKSNSKIRILRDNVELFDGEIDSLRRFKDEVKEVAAGYECGISIVDFRDFAEGDIIEAYTMEEIETSIAEANKAAEQKREEQAAAAAAKAEEHAEEE